MNRVVIALVSATTITSIATTITRIACAQTPQSLSNDWIPPAQGMVPDAATAVTVALAVLPSLGPDTVREIKEDAPWHATKVGDAWQVYGTLPADVQGGTYVVVIAQRDARVIRIYHEQ